MARDEQVPIDPSTTVDTEIDPTQTIPQRGQPQGDGSDLDGGEYTYWLRDGVTPYRMLDRADTHVFSHGRRRRGSTSTDRPRQAVAVEPGGDRRDDRRAPAPDRARDRAPLPLDPGPDEDFAPVQSPDDLAEADSVGDQPDDTPQPPPSQQGASEPSDLPQGAMNEQQIRDAGLRIDVPYETPLPGALKYQDTGQKVWTPPAGFRQGMPPIDEQLARDLGVSRDLGQDQEGAEGGSTSGESGNTG